MGWLDRLLGRKSEFKGQHEDDATPEEHRRHVEQSANPGMAPPVPPDPGESSADEVEEARTEPRGVEKTEESRLRDDQEGRSTREPPQAY
ncbi:MAG TPA: hypothetical protein VH306_00395 [Gaiellaceae bacterium]|jgi:hypothetical protein